jgi:4-alpha-glucanotransferase
VKRSSGLLLHPSSLPGPFGIGDIGPQAYRWVDTLAAAKQSWWQILPLGPTGLGDSPYMSFSAFAGNVNLLSPELLERDGLVTKGAWTGRSFSDAVVDYPAVTAFKAGLVRTAYEKFRGGNVPGLRAMFDEFTTAESAWLDDYALFMAVREKLGNAGRASWPKEILTRQPAAVARLKKELDADIARHRFGQFLFDRQWLALKAYANEKKVGIIGDVPIFVAGDSADVWANPSQFLLGPDGTQAVQAGVPPDYFSEDGQLWGNPVYDWAAMKTDHYRWWTARLVRTLSQVDLVRLDHFRGFAQAWHVPAADNTARDGKWVDGPGAKLFQAVKAALGDLPFIAEDLGLITSDVVELRTGLDLPGMRVLQFAIGDPTNPYQPHNFEPATVVYTGTHDNDTTAGWFALLPDRDKNFWTEYLGRPLTDPAAELMRLAWSSVAVLAIAPLQDVLGLGSEARMNTPGVAEGNWRWRFRPDQFKAGMVERLAELTVRYRRDGNNSDAAGS